MSNSPLGNNIVTQVGIIVPNIESAIQAWSAVLGVPAPEILIVDTVDKTQAKYHGQPTEARAKLAFFKLGQVSLELIEPMGEPSTWNDQLQGYGASLHHIAFEVKGMTESLDKLAAHGMTLLQKGEYEGGRYAYVDGVKDFGAVVELLEND